MPNDQEMKLRSQKHCEASLKGNAKAKKKDDIKIGPIILGVFLFVIVGSVFIQILNASNSGGDNILI